MKNRDYIPLTIFLSVNIPAEITNLRSKGISAISLTSETTKGEKSEVSIFLYVMRQSRTNPLDYQRPGIKETKESTVLQLVYLSFCMVLSLTCPSLSDS